MSTVYSSDNEVRVRFICSFQFFYKVLEMCCFQYFSVDNERAVVIKQSIIVCQWKRNMNFHR